MIRNQITITMPNEMIKSIDEVSKKCEITRSNFVEISSTLKIVDKLDNDEVNELFLSLITKTSCNVRKQFKKLHCNLPLEVKKECLKLFYEANLIPKISYSGVKQANFYKGYEFLFYYAILDMKNIDIDEYINGLKSVKKEVVGKEDAPSNEYIYLGRELYFNRSDYLANHFKDICSKLGKESCDIIKIHYTEINKLIEILKNI